MNISINNLKKSFGDRTVVDIEQFNINKGEILGLVGNNGAGKTTLFRLILDLLKADNGMVTIGDINPAEDENWKTTTGAFIDDSFLIDFLTPEEIEQMAMEMAVLRDAGADGFVIGCLTADGELDGNAMEPLLKEASGLGLTLHRCIDVSRNLEDTYRAAATLGFDTVLTSGGAGKCADGMETIGRLLQLRDTEHGPEVLIGAGVNAKVISAFREKLPGARAFHMSGKTEMESGMRFRREGVPMGLPGLDEWHIPVTSGEAVREAKQALE